ncbi:MAG: ribbon-helix-helix protein, CopG family [Bauldia sp.]|nr:MAG: ribbon-helix-helix protein, CopG family [Bauldia sp.]MBZ0226876.1 ribbon-helix-helix domain-containing protein [Bauldia sp.]
MKTLTVKLPDSLAADIEAESRARRISKSDVVRERLQQSRREEGPAAHLKDIAHLFGSVVDDLPADLSARTEDYLKATGYGRDRGR